jgi:uncharacterized phage-like protein YoqJ
VIVGITGHRPDRIGAWDPLHPVVERVQRALRDAIAKYRPAKLLTGMALGVDQWAAEACVELGVPFAACLPFDGQSDPWPPPAQERWQVLLEKAAEIVVVSPGPYKPWKMQRRNEYVVDNCDKLLAVHDGSDGGTYNCLRYARTVDREIDLLDWQLP